MIWHIQKHSKDNNATGYLLDYLTSKKYYSMISIDLTNHQVFDANPKEIH